MNEPLIDKLLHKAGARFGAEGIDYSDFTSSKFAELIVKEMCDMMEQCEDDCYSVEPSERPTEYIEWLYAWRTRFEKHFGVEE